MSEKQIKKLTPEQEALIPAYRDKWKRIAFSTERIDRDKTVKAVELLYYLTCQKKPEITFYESPYKALNQSFKEEWVEYRGDLEEYLRHQLQNQIESSFLNCSHTQSYWQAFQGILSNCGLIFCTDTEVLICYRPTQLHLDNLNRLHAEGKPAMQFADGYSIYALHGVTLPEIYGKHHPKEWQPLWLLQERNVELRKILIREIGYSRIIEELEDIELDSYQEYTEYT